jgi:hypothetical protein
MIAASIITPMSRMPGPGRGSPCARALRACGAALLTLAGLCVGGCNIAGPVANVIQGPPKMDAQYILADVPTVVFIDDPRNVVNPVTLRKVIAETASQQLMMNEVLTTTISPQDAIAITQRSDRSGDKMSVEDIGRSVGAQQVIYVQMQTFAHTPDGFTPRPVASAQVKVIDVAAGQRVFPEEGEGWPVNASGAAVSPSVFSTRSSSVKVFEALAHVLGAEIAKVFYRHEYQELGTRLK